MITEKEYLAAQAQLKRNAEIIKQYKEQKPTKPILEIGKIYKTKWATGEEFLLLEIDDRLKQYKGILQDHKELGVIGLNFDRL